MRAEPPQASNHLLNRPVRVLLNGPVRVPEHANGGISGRIRPVVAGGTGSRVCQHQAYPYARISLLLDQAGTGHHA